MFLGILYYGEEGKQTTVFCIAKLLEITGVLIEWSTADKRLF